jgi:hypothetical protein
VTASVRRARSTPSTIRKEGVTIMPQDVATLLIERVGGRSVTVVAYDATTIAELRRFAETADRPGTSTFTNACVDAVWQEFTIDHDDLAAVRLVTS